MVKIYTGSQTFSDVLLQFKCFGILSYDCLEGVDSQ